MDIFGKLKTKKKYLFPITAIALVSIGIVVGVILSNRIEYSVHIYGDSERYVLTEVTPPNTDIWSGSFNVRVHVEEINAYTENAILYVYIKSLNGDIDATNIGMEKATWREDGTAHLPRQDITTNQANTTCVFGSHSCAFQDDDVAMDVAFYVDMNGYHGDFEVILECSRS